MSIDLTQVDWYSVLPRLGIDSQYLTFNKKEGPCPLCGGKSRFRFTDRNGKGDYYCNQCGAGDGAGMLMKFHGWSFVETLREISGDEVSDKKITYKKPEREKSSVTDFKKNAEKLRQVWVESKPIQVGDPAWLYLHNRVPFLSELPDSSVLRLHSGLKYWDVETDERGNDKYIDRGTFPALIALVKKNGKPISIHRTYLTETGEKAPLEKVKKLMSGTEGMSGGGIELFPIVNGVLGVSEGIEKSLAIRTARKNRLPVWSLVSAGMMSNFIIPASVKELHIFADNDEAGIGAAKKLEQRAIEKKIRVEVHIPQQKDMDFDDVWKEICSRKKAA